MKKQILPINVLLLILLALIWGSSYILMKKGLVSFSVLQVSMLRIVFACVTLLPFLPKAIKNTKQKDLVYVALVAFLGSGIPSYLFPLAITNIDSSIAGIINALTPVFTMLFGWAFFKFKPTVFKILGLILAMIGAGILILQGAQGLSVNYYALAAVAATICYGFGGNILKAKLNHIPSAPLTAYTFLMIGPIALIILLNTNFLEVLTIDPKAYLALSFIGILGVLGTAIALVLFNFLIKRTDALYATSVTFLIPIVAMAWGYFDQEKIGIFHFVGMAFILVGVYLVNRTFGVGTIK